MIFLTGCGTTAETNNNLPLPDYPQGFEECVADDIDRREITDECSGRALIDWYQWKRMLEENNERD